MPASPPTTALSPPIRPVSRGPGALAGPPPPAARPSARTRHARDRPAARRGRPVLEFRLRPRPRSRAICACNFICASSASVTDFAPSAIYPDSCAVWSSSVSTIAALHPVDPGIDLGSSPFAPPSATRSRRSPQQPACASGAARASNDTAIAPRGGSQHHDSSSPTMPRKHPAGIRVPLPEGAASPVAHPAPAERPVRGPVHRPPGRTGASPSRARPPLPGRKSPETGRAGSAAAPARPSSESSAGRRRGRRSSPGRRSPRPGGG